MKRLRRLTPQEQFDLMTEYLLLKVQVQDWHGVADAAMDLRELAARYPDLDERSRKRAERS